VARIIEQPTAEAIEHLVKETSKKTGEPATTLETSEVVVTNEALVQTFCKVCTKVR